MAVITSMVPTSTAALILSGVPISAASRAVITSAAALRRQVGETDAPIVTNICGYAVAEDARLKSISPPDDMVCAMFPPNRLFSFCSKKVSLKDRHDIVDNCEWNAWCIDTYDCSEGCGIEQARAQFGTTRCHAASNPYCQLTRLANTHTDEADPYWSVGCGNGHYSIHHYLLEQKTTLDTSVLSTTTTTTTTTSSSKRNPYSTPPFAHGDANFTAPHVQAPVATISTSKPVIPTSSSPPPAPSTLQPTPTPSANSLPSSSVPKPFTSSSTHPIPEPQTSDLPTYIFSANTPSEEEENQKTHNPKPAILGSVIGALAVIYILLFTWWYRGPRRRKRAREAKGAAEAALRERGFWRRPDEFEAHGLTEPNGFQGPHGPQEIHELGFGTMTNPKTPKLPDMPNTPQSPKTFDTLQTKTENGIWGGNGKGELPGPSPLSPMALSRWGDSQATSGSVGSPRSGATSSTFGSRFGSTSRAGAESGIFGIEKPAKVVVNTTTKEVVAELDGRYMTFEERELERRERLEGINVATEPVRWEGSGSGGGAGIGTSKGRTLGGGSSNGAATPMGMPVTRATLVPPTEWYLGQKAEDERRTIHVGRSHFGGN